jgi:NAD-dependent deacetylase
MKITAITGSGVSAASNIPTYRSAGSGWDNYANGIAHYTRYGNHLPEVWKHWTKMGRLIEAAEPNASHLALAKHEVFIITQNVDGLHTKAGSKDVIELHGDMRTMRCLRCKKHAPCDLSTESPVCPHCGSSRVRSNAVLFGEQLSRKKVDAAMSAINASDLVIVAGTSGTVWPARGFVEHAVLTGRETVLFDMEAWPDAPDFSGVSLGPCEENLPEYLDWVSNLEV